MTGALSDLTFFDVAIGDELPALEMPITRTLIVSGALAAHDYRDGHHDPEAARAHGAADIFMDILTSNGLVGRYVTDWTGPAAVIEKVAIRLGAPNYPGDTMIFTGTVTAAEVPAGRADGRGVVDIAVRGANSRGDHVTGTVRVALPLGTDESTLTGPSS